MSQLRRFNDEFLAKLSEDKYFGTSAKGWIHLLEKLEQIVSDHTTYDSKVAVELLVATLNISYRNEAFKRFMVDSHRERLMVALQQIVSRIREDDSPRLLDRLAMSLVLLFNSEDFKTLVIRSPIFGVLRSRSKILKVPNFFQKWVLRHQKPQIHRVCSQYYDHQDEYFTGYSLATDLVEIVKEKKIVASSEVYGSHREQSLSNSTTFSPDLNAERPTLRRENSFTPVGLSEQETGVQEEQCEDWEDFSSNLSDDDEESEEKQETIPTLAEKKMTEASSNAPYTLSTGPSLFSEERRTQVSLKNRVSDDGVEATSQKCCSFFN